ncbi:MAG: glycine cleavage system aminomethyltransferase GcvT, partial [Thermodesulfobacteriota bacterium]
IKERIGDKEVEIVDKSDSFAQIALQGPLSESVLQGVCKDDLSLLKYYRFIISDVAGASSIISRTGYTGEDGFELYMPAESSREVWRELLKKGAECGIRPCGLGARDTLRLEMGYPLYGHELGEDINPFEAGLGWVVKLNKGTFIGKKALEEVQRKGIEKRIVGFKMLDKGIPRAGYKLFSGGKDVGYVTSGTMSPSINIAIGMGFVRTTFPGIDQEIAVEIRGRLAKARIVNLPFYRSKRKKGLKRRVKEENDGFSGRVEVHKRA